MWREVGLGVLFALAAAQGGDDAYDSNALIRLARDAVIAEVHGKPAPTPESQTAPKPVFVTVEAKGRVVGCRGSLKTRSASLEREVIAAARAAARHDPRYRPLNPKSLEEFLVTVTVVDRQEQIQSVDGLEPADGLVLVSGGSTGVVLPWEGKDPKVRLEWAYRKAGVSRRAKVVLYRLLAKRYRG